MSALIQNQNDFLADIALLIQHAQNLGYLVTAGEMWRPPEMQEYYFKIGKSQIKVGGNHGRRLAVDLNIFLRGQLATLDEIRPLGQYWKSLNSLNRWGGEFTGLADGPHFERNFLG